MELLILPDQFIIKYSPIWMFLLLLSGLLLFFVSKRWRNQLKKRHKHSFMPGVLFTVSFIFLVGGINFYVYKVVLNKDGIILFNIKQFNEKIKWSDIQKVEYQQNQKIALSIHDDKQAVQLLAIDLADLDKDSVAKVKILIDLKVKQNRNNTYSVD
ncbi:MAG: hypothetical protein OQL19_01360 [Gammaproteobacteria bacterium]|nr:hypothetical protein [Gammaproteobacteria bacterium]